LKNKEQNNKNYLTQYHQHLIELIIVYINKETEDEDNEAWTTNKACSHVLHIIVQIVPISVLELILKYVNENINKEDVNSKNSALLVFHACLSNTHKLHISDLVSKHINKLVKCIFHENDKIKKSASLLFVRITKNCSKIFEQSNLNILIPSFMNAFTYPNQIAINYCQSIINVTKSLGDMESKKSTSEY
jgi:hypothetical protein